MFGGLWDALRAIGIVPLAGCVLFVAAGFMLEAAEPNLLFGVHTRWTMADEEVWRDTHKRAGIAYKLAGVVSLAGAFSPADALVLEIVLFLAVGSYTVVYSYYDYRSKWFE